MARGLNTTRRLSAFKVREVQVVMLVSYINERSSVFSAY